MSKKIESGDYLVVDGTVSCSNRGHGGLYGAGLEQITFILHNEQSEVLWDATERPSYRLPNPHWR